jgi:hypothetical protein
MLDDEVEEKGGEGENLTAGLDTEVKKTIRDIQVSHILIIKTITTIWMN